jgi:uncharacterized membrane protein
MSKITEALDAVLTENHPPIEIGKSAPDLLWAAAQHMADRAATYDQPDGERSMGRTVKAFNLITGHALSEAEGWLLMQLLKDVRQWQRPGYHADSAEDCIAYAALKAEALQQGG